MKINQMNLDGEKRSIHQLNQDPQDYSSILDGTYYTRAQDCIKAAIFLGAAPMVFWETEVQLFYDAIWYSLQEIMRLNHADQEYLAGATPLTLSRFMEISLLPQAIEHRTHKACEELERLVHNVRNPGYYGDSWKVPTQQQLNEFARLAEVVFTACKEAVAHAEGVMYRGAFLI